MTPINITDVLWYFTTIFGGGVIGLLVWGAKRELARIASGQESLIRDQATLRDKVSDSIALVHKRIDSVEQEFYMLKGEHQMVQKMCRHTHSDNNVEH